MAKALVGLLGVGGALAGLLAYMFSKKEGGAVTAGGQRTSSGQEVPLSGENIARPAAGASVAERMANAISMGPEAMRATANELRREGNASAADELLSRITAQSAGLPPVVTQTSSGPVVAPAPVVLADAPAKLRAQTLTAALKAFAPQRDDARVTAYQQQEGLTADGLYGPDTASAVARAGVIPVPPAFFARDPTRRRLSIDSYRATVAEQQRLHGGDWSSALRGLPS